jgi:O-antigen ligase
MARPAERRVSYWSPDATSVLRVYAVVLLVLPAELAVSGFGGAVTPVLLIGLGCGWLWTLGLAVPWSGVARGYQPVRLVILPYGAAVLVSYVIATTEIRVPIEATAADRGLLITAALCGTALLAADGIRTRARLDALIRTLVAAGAVAAAIGIVQFLSDFDLSRSQTVPGLWRVDSGYEAIAERSGFNRVAGASLHPIEFSAILTMLVPLALHLAHWTKQVRWRIATGLILVAIPMSLSRTGAIGLLVVLLVLVPTWDRTWRRQMLRFGILIVIVVNLAAPGLLGAIGRLFGSFFDDPSITSRRSDYANLGDFTGDHLIFGRGYATFLPENFDFLDNQYLVGLIEIGIVGVLMMVAVFIVGFTVSVATRRASDDPGTRDLALSLGAAAIVPLVTSATFDFFSFPAARGMAFLIVGCAGALWRIERVSRRAGQADRAARSDPSNSPLDDASLAPSAS